MGYIYNFLACRGSRLPLAKRLLYFSLFTLSFFTSPALAQIEDGKAFYVYRNDGDFNGFFYDEVIRMGYSKIDFNGFQHDQYVVQEIETADSLYRIPLAAIDSIGFQQPEIRFSPRVKFMDGSPLLPYITEISSPYRIHLRRDTPQELIPKSGDVLMSFDEEIFDIDPYRRQEYAGYCMKVSFIYTKEKEYLVDLGLVTSLEDIFDQFISTEQVSMDEEGNTKRRMAGYDSYRRAKEGFTKKPFFEYSGAIKRELPLPYDGTLSVEAGLDCKVILSMAYNISRKRLFVKTSLDTNIDVTPKLTVKTSSSFEAVVDGVPQCLKSIKFPAVCPLFQTRPLPDLLVRGGGDLSLTASLAPVSFKWRQTFTFDTDQFPIASYVSYLTELDEKEKQEKEQEAIDKPGDVELSLSGFIQAGFKLSANIETNDWFEYVFSSSIGVDLFVGPKLEGKLGFSKAAFEKDGAYGLFKDNYIKLHGLSLDLEARAELQAFWGDRERTTFFELSKQFLTSELFLLPDFKTTTANYETDYGRLEVEVFPSRHLLWPTYIGTAVYNYKGDRVLNDLRTQSYLFDIKDAKYKTVFKDLKLRCGTYQTYPYVLLAGVELPVKSAQTSFFIAPQLLIGDSGRMDSIQVTSSAQQQEIPIITNTDNLKIAIVSEDGNWLKASFTEYDEKNQYCSMILDMTENASHFPRSCDVIVTATEGNYTTSDTLRVQQAYGLEGFKEAKVGVTVTGTGSYSWSKLYEDGETSTGSQDQTSYTISMQIPVTSRREGNYIYVSGTVSDPNSYNGDVDHDHGPLRSRREENTIWALELVVDASSGKGKVVGGNLNYTHTLSREYSYHYEYTRQGQNEPYDVEEKEESQTLNDVRTFTWAGDVPYGKPGSYPISPSVTYVGNLTASEVSGQWSYEDHGSSRAYRKHTDYPESTYYNYDKKSNSHESRSCTANSAAISIWLGY